MLNGLHELTLLTYLLQAVFSRPNPQINGSTNASWQRKHRETKGGYWPHIPSLASCLLP